MKIQEQKIPSPSDIKKGPTQFTNEELTQLKSLQSEISQTTTQFGQLYLTKIRLEEQETLLKTKINELKTKETTLAKSLSDKYGQGSLDIETGTFTPTE